MLLYKAAAVDAYMVEIIIDLPLFVYIVAEF